MSLADAAPLLIRDPVVLKEFRRTFIDAAQRLERIGRGDGLKDGEWTLLADTLHNDSRRYVRHWGVGSFGKYPIEIRGLGGGYYVSAPEFDDVGYFDSVDDAESHIHSNWIDVFPGRTFRKPFDPESHSAAKTSPATSRRRQTSRREAK